ncbi:7-carboxy-7-deazaguanine synthase QueE [Bacillus sp. 2205SS5-2]|uniref:7-carboxy-7-deazaguanine synthase QueE n=1 Tax=Bacillus sp. 2205SS5-2 TaxID=3109031 RepID=UPI003004FFE2
MKKFPILEVFGPTIQGEGMVIGQKTMFIRTAGCDYACDWCDSAFTWDGSGKEDIRMMTAVEIWEELHRIGGHHFSHVTISGGNPALLPHLGELLEIFKDNGITSALETQGSRWQDWFLQIDELTISPKPPSSKMRVNIEVLDEILVTLQRENVNTSLKVVIFDLEDLQFATGIHQKYPKIPFFIQTGNRSITEADNQKLIAELMQNYQWLIDQVMKSTQLNDVRVLPQLHTYVWGNKRGV